ncbi:secretion protein HlyD [Flavobacterium akiainvivens]|uniref:Secretion protein HlyD n=1 Tax=Flavobacterium akiainvivens TaxID=1202724 RepID=A0A0M8MFK5_9FLAO|nr:HlyD family secretion protein [Flavobacterium akiainvivens]KOS04747.1 secretion protein HlyD [Flavobacterium akiainvivens]SFQ66739.1 membrane fusion protein, multidrug efflux system [Flavobacterium akiainvivens]
METTEKKKTNKKFAVILTALVVVGGGYGIYKYLHGQAHEITDDAQVEKNMNPIIPRVTGYITKVFVKDNQQVKKGDTLFVIDDNDYVVRVEEAKAALAAAEGSFAVAKADIGGAQAGVSVSDANIQSSKGNIEAAKVRVWRANNDFERYQNLYNNKSITKQQFEQAQAAKQEADANLRVLQQAEAASRSQRAASVSRSAVSNKQTEVANANIERAKATLRAAELNLSYTVVTAAVDGQVSAIDIQPGQLVQPGQALFYIINSEEAWVVANFKETQLGKMKEGQKVIIKADAYDDAEFEGQVSSFSPATGARFSLLPPDNATGNFVKTVQRVPVKITLTANNDKEKVKLLRPGMNVEVDVHLK